MKLSRAFLLSFFLVFLLESIASAQGRAIESYRGRDAVAGEIIVRFRAADAADGRKRATQAAEKDRDIGSVEAVGSAGAVRLRSHRRTVDSLIDEFAARQDVLYAEPNYVVRAADLPNDAYLGSQWHLRDTTLYQGGFADIRAEAAWNLTQGDRSIVIAVIDTGVAYDHPDLAANMWSAPAEFSVSIDGQTITCPPGSYGFNAITRNCDPMDDEGHGTHIAGIIGAVGNNGFGVSGINRVSSMMALKFLDAEGVGATTDAVAAIQFAIQTKAIFGPLANVRVLNASWGGRGFSQALQDEINLANSRDMLFVTAAGNDGRSIDTLSEYPASYATPNMITVAATTSSDFMTSFSNYGLAKVHLSAPGDTILSTWPSMTFALKSGTSSATAMVSGAAALVLAGCPTLNTAELRANLLNPASLDLVPALAGKTVTGGRLNVFKALTNCGAVTPSAFILKATQGFKVVGQSGGRVTSAVTLTVQSGFSFPVSLSIDVPPGLTASLGELTLTPASPTTVITVDTQAGIPPGIYLINITGTSGDLSKKTGFALTVVPDLSGDQTVTGALSSSTSQRLISDPEYFFERYRVFLPESKQVVFSVTSEFTPRQRLLNADGSIRHEGFGFTKKVGLTETLPAGEYFYDVSSDTSSEEATGSFTLTFTTRLPPPTLTSVAPPLAGRGTSIDVTFTGTNFFAPLTLKGPTGFSLSNVAILDTTTATATLSISGSVPPSQVVSTHKIQVETPSGTTSAINFVVLDHTPRPPVITAIDPIIGNQGQSTLVTFTGVDFLSPVTVAVDGSGVTVSSATTQNLFTAGATFVVAPDAPLGERHVTLTSAVAPGQPSNAVTFTVLPPLPTLTGITPTKALRGTDINVALTGTFFDSAMTIVYGTIQFNGPFAPATFVPDTTIVVDNIQVVSPTSATATVHVPASASFGGRGVRVTTAGGVATLASALSVVPPPPVLTGISPATGELGTSVAVTLTGTFPIPGLNIAAPPGISITNTTVVSESVMTATIVIPSNYPLGPIGITVINTGGSSDPMNFVVKLRVPAISALTPDIGITGTTTNVTLTGVGFIPGSTSLLVSGAGVIASNVNAASFSSMTATLTVAAGATPGPRSLTVTTAGGTSPSFSFTVVLPFPDLVSSSSHTGNFAVGFNETYTVLVRNVGTAATTGTITLTDTLPASLSFVSGAGTGWSCLASAQVVQCANSGPLNLGGSSTISMIVRPASPGTVTHTVSVATPGDLVATNNSGSEPIIVMAPPTFSFSSPPALLTAGQQSSVGLTIPSSFFHDLTGVLTLTFAPTAANPADDPAIQFATGGRQVAFTIPANTLQARFGSNAQAGPIGFQAGTVAGTLKVTGTMQAAAVQQTLSKDFTIPAQPPSILSAATDTEDGFAVSITLLSTMRQVDSVELLFSTNGGVNVNVSCGTVVGCSVKGETITLDIKSVCDNWFSNDRTFGSMSRLRVPISVSGGIQGRVFVRLKNAMGLSNLLSVALP